MERADVWWASWGGVSPAQAIPQRQQPPAAAQPQPPSLLRVLGQMQGGISMPVDVLMFFGLVLSVWL